MGRHVREDPPRRTGCGEAKIGEIGRIGGEFDPALQRMKEELRLRRLALKTKKAYLGWPRRFYAYRTTVGLTGGDLNVAGASRPPTVDMGPVRYCDSTEEPRASPVLERWDGRETRTLQGWGTGGHDVSAVLACLCGPHADRSQWGEGSGGGHVRETRTVQG